MTRNWKFCSFVALLVGLALSPSLRATDPEKLLTEGEKLILRQISDLKTDLKTEIKEARNQADAKNRELEDRLRTLGDRLDRLESSVRQMSSTPRTSYFQPTPLTPAPAGFGTVVLQNTWGDTATVMLNDRAVVVPPYQTVALENQPAGTYTYEVLVNGFGRIRGPVSRVLNNNDRMVISVYPVPAIR